MSEIRVVKASACGVGCEVREPGNNKNPQVALRSAQGKKPAPPRRDSILPLRFSTGRMDLCGIL
jgi:hypothetical protein